MNMASKNGDRGYNPESKMGSILNELRKGPLKVAIVGSGNFGTAIAKLVGENTARSYIFQDVVAMWTLEELIDGKKLTEIINTEHENVKYLPGVKLPVNVKAVPDLLEAVRGAQLLVFCLPHQFLRRTCQTMKPVIGHNVKAISLIKGLQIEDGNPVLLTNVISDILNIDCCVLSGANVAKDIAREEFSETTIGYEDPEAAAIWQQLFDTRYFRVNCIPDIAGVGVCGAVKNVAALAAGFVDGMRLGTNAKAAIIRVAFQEMKNFSIMFFDGVLQETFLDSAGIADVITTCFGGRNVKCAAEFAATRGDPTPPTWEKLEKELLNGQKLQGTLTCKEVYEVVAKHNMLDRFPLITATYRVAFEGAHPRLIIEIFQGEMPRHITLISECTSVVLPGWIHSFRHREELAEDIKELSIKA